VRYIKLQVIIAILVALKADRYVIGVDGGATKTVALIGIENGKILGRGESGPSNYHNIGTGAASIAVREAVRKAKRRAGVRGTAEVAVVALAAVDSERDRAIVLRSIRDIKIARTNLVIHDSVAALHAATQEGPCVIVISGTGCVAAGVNSAGRYVRAGGWGYLIDDEGSAYNIGAQALRGAFRMLDGRAPKTKLGPLLKRRLRVRTLEDALSQIYSDGLGVDGVADLTPLVSKLASTDQVSREILGKAGISLAELACAVAKKLGITRDAFRVVLVGGTFKAGPYLLQPLRARIRRDCPHAKVEIMKTEPVLGALSLATFELRKSC
jgi:N-acetylglucosamine kinase-like BadF-type ATPase